MARNVDEVFGGMFFEVAMEVLDATQPDATFREFVEDCPRWLIAAIGREAELRFERAEAKEAKNNE